MKAKLEIECTHARLVRELRNCADVLSQNSLHGGALELVIDRVTDVEIDLERLYAVVLKQGGVTA